MRPWPPTRTSLHGRCGAAASARPSPTPRSGSPTRPTSTDRSPRTTWPASRAHVRELHRLGLVDADGAVRLDAALTSIGDAMADGTFAWDPSQEDVHMNVEAAVRTAVGPELAGQLQAGRSRNEEVVSDERRWLLDAIGALDDAATAAAANAHRPRRGARRRRPSGAYAYAARTADPPRPPPRRLRRDARPRPRPPTRRTPPSRCQSRRLGRRRRQRSRDRPRAPWRPSSGSGRSPPTASMR